MVDPHEAGETIAAEAGRLERLVQDVLELARLNRIEFDVEREPIDLGAVARDAIRRYEPQARAFGVDLVLDVNGGAPAVGDAERSLQIVSNLVENALRVTPPGGRVSISAHPGLIAVEDTGPGLAADEVTACVRPLLPLVALRRLAPRRHRARARDRQAADGADGRAGRGRERAGRDPVRSAAAGFTAV